jgi:hypothetical protein
LAAQDRSAETVRLLLVDARLQLAHAHHDVAVRRLEMADRLIAARHQSTNPDEYELALLKAQSSMQAGDYATAAKQATGAADLARAAAIDERSSAWVGEALLRRAQAEKAAGESASAMTDAREALHHLGPNLLPADSLIVAARGIAGGDVKAN